MAGWAAVAISMMRTFVVAMMLASASSFAPSPKTQLALRRPAQAPPRVMPAMKLTPGNPLYYIGFPSQYEKDDKAYKVCPYHCAPPWQAPWSHRLREAPSPPSSSPLPFAPSPTQPSPSHPLHHFRVCAGV